MNKSKPAQDAEVVVKSDSVNLVQVSRALWVGVSGDVSVEMVGVGTAIVFKGIQGLLPVSVTRVNSTNTTATDIVAIS